MNNTIKILQGLIRPDQFNAIVDWNKQRNRLVYNAELEVSMLKEEVQEYFDADNLVDKLDAVDDLLFVAAGTAAKTAYQFVEKQLDFTQSIEMVLSDFAGRCSAEGIDLSLVGEMISEGLDFVIEANALKLAEKNADGKVQKPEGFEGPEVQLATLIDKTKNREPVSPDVSKMFSGQ